MRTNDPTELKNSVRPTIASACLASCRKLIGQLQETKAALSSEFRERFAASEQLLHLALNEAEALAWQTEYPYLVFPALATEKAEAVVAWQQRQRVIRREHFEYAFAA